MYIQGGNDESGSFIDGGISIPRIKWSLSHSAKTCLIYFFSVNITNICKLRCRSFSWWGSGAKSASLLGRKSLQSSIPFQNLHKFTAWWPLHSKSSAHPQEKQISVSGECRCCSSAPASQWGQSTAPPYLNAEGTWRQIPKHSNWSNQNEWICSRKAGKCREPRAFPKICFLKMSLSFNSCNGRVTSKMVIHHPIERCPI